MHDSIFAKIIRGDIPAHKIHEDDKTYIFLDIYPAQPGHMLVVPKIQVDRLEDLSDADYTALMASARLAMRRIIEVLGPDYRACLKVEGFDVPHAHLHIIPCRNAQDFWAKQRMDAEPDHEALAAMAEKLAF